MLVKREGRRIVLFLGILAVILLSALAYHRDSALVKSPLSTVHKWIGNKDSTATGHHGTGPSIESDEIEVTDPAALGSSNAGWGASTSAGSPHVESFLVSTDEETTIPSAPLPANPSANPSARVKAHVHGFTIFDRLYLRNGTFFVVTSDEAFPPRDILIGKPLEIGKGFNLEPTDEDMQIIPPSKATELLGEFATRVPGFTVFFHDPDHFMRHFYHFWGEIIIGMWRVYSVLSLDKPGYVYGKTPHLPFPSRFIMPAVVQDEWRDRAGLNGPFMHAAFPGASIEKNDYWKDLKKLNTTVAFERAMIINRNVAHKHPFSGLWFKMMAGTMNVTVPDYYWEPVRHSLLSNLVGHIPQIDAKGRVLASSLNVSVQHSKDGDKTGASVAPPTYLKPVVTYISRQGTGRRLTDKDHQALVKSLMDLEKEGVCILQIPMMERLGIKEQIALIAKTTILVGVHGNGLTHQLFMPPSLRSAVFEIVDPPSYPFDYEMLARNMGHKHYLVHNDTLLTFPKGQYHEGVIFTDGFHGEAIPVYGPVIADMIRKRLSQPDNEVED